ncbi:AI-2E family transporter [Candidatus Parcubacteria bacterium]|nr:MAG: AI-2E family transporter [Candidatus Parcubacteria bacterium]
MRLSRASLLSTTSCGEKCNCSFAIPRPLYFSAINIARLWETNGGQFATIHPTMKFRHYREGLFVFLLVASIALAGWVVLPLAMPLLWAGIFAILLFPLVDRLARRMPRWLAALAGTGIVLVGGLVPLVFIAGIALQEAVSVYNTFFSDSANGAAQSGAVGAVVSWLAGLLAPYGITQAALTARLGDAFASAASFLLNGLVAAGQFTFSFVLQAAIMLYLLFFFLKDGSRIIAWLIHILPLGDQYERQIFSDFAATTRAVTKGTIAVALAQGAIGGVAFWAAGVPAPVLWGIAMTFFALIPSIGPAIIWAPVGFALLWIGDWYGALVVFGVGVGVISVIDNILRPLLVGRDLNIPDPIIFVATLGGIATFGLSGFVLGPLVFAFARTMVTFFNNTYRDALNHNAKS